MVVYKTGGLETLASLNAPTISSVSTTCFLRFTLSKIKHWQRELCCAKQELISGKADWATYKPLNGVNTSLLINHTTTLYSAPFFTQRIPSGNYFTLKWSNYGRKWWNLQVWSKVGVVCSQKARFTVNYSIYHLTHSVNLHGAT